MGRRVFATLLLTAAAAAADAVAPSGDVAASLASARPDDGIPIIVTYRGDAVARSLKQSLSTQPRRMRRLEVLRRLKEGAAADQAPVLAWAEAVGARDIRPLWIAGAVAMRATPAQIERLLEDPGVLRVRLDRALVAPMPMVGETLPAEWNIVMVRAPELWARGFQGQGAVVAIVDTGVDAQHPDLAATWRGGTNSWFDAFGEHEAPSDVSGHGTQAAGLALGGSAGGTSIGVAPEARWIAARVFNDAGEGQESDLHLAFQWLLDPDGDPATDDAPDVVNGSWSITDGGVCDTVLQPDIDALQAADIAIVFAAGNFGPGADSSASPANNAHVVGAGAVDVNRTVALYSGRGPSACDGSVFPHVVAPGDSVMTTDLSLGGTPFYTLVSGTSFAAPHVAGVMALLRGAAPTATAEAVQAAIVGTAADLGTPGPDDDYGNGLVDAVAALEALEIPADEDSDGYAATVDCNDHDAGVHPGAAEKKHDGVDQDCNGYDLTIKVYHAVYSHDGGSLRIRATSALGRDAALEVEGLGPLTWRGVYGDWIWEGGAAGEPQAHLTIRGIEGAVGVAARMPKRRT